MPKRPRRQENPSEEGPKFGPFKFSDSLLKDMAAYLSNQRRRAVSLEEANEDLVKLTYFMKWVLDHKRPSNDNPP
jgi:hypothetical protein